jgi:hypothetical protein
MGMFQSKSPGVQAEAMRLFAPNIPYSGGAIPLGASLQVGMIDWNNPTQVRNYFNAMQANAQQRQQAAAGPAQAPFDQLGLATLGIQRGSQTAQLATQALTSQTQGPKVALAAQQVAQALVSQSTSAADAQQKLDAWVKTLGTADPAVLQFVAQVRSATQALEQMGQSTMSLPQQLAAVSNQMKAIDWSQPGAADTYKNLQGQQAQLVQSGLQAAQQYLQAQDALNIQLRQGREDYQRQTQRSTDQFNLQQERAQQQYDITRFREEQNYHIQMQRSQTAYNLQVFRTDQSFRISQARSQESFNRQQLYAQQDYNLQRRHATRDFLYQEQQYIKQVSFTLDPYSVVQAQATTSAQQLMSNVAQQNQMYRTAGQQLNQLRRMGVSQQAIDLFGLSDPKNIQNLNEVVRTITPQLVDTFNSEAKNRFDWTKGLATNKSSTQWRDMEHQFNVAASDAQTAFETANTRAQKAFDITTNQAVADHNRQMKQMSHDYQTQTAYASEDNQRMLRQNAADFKRMTNQNTTDFNTQMGYMREDYQTQVSRMMEAINHIATNAYGTNQQIMNRALRESTGQMHTYFQNVRSQYLAFARDMANMTMPGGGGIGAGGSLSGRAGTIGAALSSAGYSNAAVAGILGNLQQESGLSPTAGRGTAHQGIAQWSAGRFAALTRFANSQGKSPWDLNTQVQFLIQEARQRGQGPSALNAYTSPQAAATYWMNLYEVSGEVPGQPGWANRRQYAQNFFTQEGGASARGRSPVGAGLRRGRTDQGVDWSGRGPVYAVAAGKITRVTAYDSGWGGSFTILKLDNPPSRDRQYVYYAEGINPTVHVGEHVRAGQIIGRATGASTGIEIGWAASGTAGFTQAHAHNQEAKGSDPGARATGYGRNFLQWIGAQHGALFSGMHHAIVGEGGPEAVIPLNERGADFVLMLLKRANEQAWASMLGGRYASRVAPTVQNTHIDSSTNFTGAVTVQAQDPNAMANALKQKARLAALTQPDLTKSTP